MTLDQSIDSENASDLLPHISNVLLCIPSIVLTNWNSFRWGFFRIYYTFSLEIKALSFKIKCTTSSGVGRGGGLQPPPPKPAKKQLKRGWSSENVGYFVRGGPPKPKTYLRHWVLDDILALFGLLQLGGTEDTEVHLLLQEALFMLNRHDKCIKIGCFLCYSFNQIIHAEFGRFFDQSIYRLILTWTNLRDIYFFLTVIAI